MALKAIMIEWFTMSNKHYTLANIQININRVRNAKRIGHMAQLKIVEREKYYLSTIKKD